MEVVGGMEIPLDEEAQKDEEPRVLREGSGSCCPAHPPAEGSIRDEDGILQRWAGRE